MDAPPIQYARTEDGGNIAYWTLGEKKIRGNGVAAPAALPSYLFSKPEPAARTGVEEPVRPFPLARNAE